MSDKPRLPPSIERLFPIEVVRLIDRFIPRPPKPLPRSPSTQRALETLRRSPKLTAMCFYGLEDCMIP
jgi:hypothetical protein